jgi:hypothetical protein
MEPGDLDIFLKPAKPSWQDSAMVLFVVAVTRRPVCSLVVVFALLEDGPYVLLEEGLLLTEEVPLNLKVILGRN